MSYIQPRVTGCRTKAVFIALFAARSLTASARNFVAPQAARQKIFQEAGDLSPNIDGIVKQIFDVQKLGQLLNPAAPASYCTGEKCLQRHKGRHPVSSLHAGHHRRGVVIPTRARRLMDSGLFNVGFFYPFLNI